MDSRPKYTIHQVIPLLFYDSVSPISVCVCFSRQIDYAGLYTGLWPWSRRRCAALSRPLLVGAAVSDGCRMAQRRAAYTAAFNCTPLGMLDSATAAAEVESGVICRPQDMFQVRRDAPG